MRGEILRFRLPAEKAGGLGARLVHPSTGAVILLMRAGGGDREGVLWLGEDVDVVLTGGSSCGEVTMLARWRSYLEEQAERYSWKEAEEP
ncbi:hypothetical protein [Streptosporangium saharense]|uniref:Uncharacterized protein n=1 Tax=Streptosporangium saharense TaxID=1706840 RepID=A0A7W7VMU5_9ACTN|nr:hypothetical protein [Streptosporangium saharense]MBB4916122.1 hypothetical protein [Streptosporangium saharense]